MLKCVFSLISAEQRVKMAANERRREHYEEQSNEYEDYLEEERNGETDLRLIILASRKEKHAVQKLYGIRIADRAASLIRGWWQPWLSETLYQWLGIIIQNAWLVTLDSCTDLKVNSKFGTVDDI